MAQPIADAERLLREPDAEAAWRLFLAGFLGTIERAARRHASDDEGAREVAAEVASKIRADWPALLLRYRAARGTAAADFRVWLAVVARNLAIDVHRSRHGRAMVPRPIARLPAWQQEVWRHVHVEGGEVALLPARLSRSAAEVAAAIHAIDDALLPGAATRRRARVHFALGEAGSDASIRPEPAADRETEPAAVLARRRVHAQVRAILGELDAEERSFLRIYFLRGATAAETARLLGAPGPSRVYQRARGLLRRLRAAFEARGLEPADMERLSDFDWSDSPNEEEA